MKKFLTVLIFCLISNSAFAEKLQGTFFGEEKFTDGSGRSFTLKINGSDMSVRDTAADDAKRHRTNRLHTYSSTTTVTKSTR